MLHVFYTLTVNDYCTRTTVNDYSGQYRKEWTCSYGFLFHPKTFHTVCFSLCPLQYLPSTAVNTTLRLQELRAQMSPLNISAYIIPATDAHLVRLLSIIINLSRYKPNVWACVTQSVSLSEWVYCTTWCQTGLHERLYRLCRYSPPPSLRLRPPPPPHDSTPRVWVQRSRSSSTFIPHPHNAACFLFIWFFIAFIHCLIGSSYSSLLSSQSTVSSKSLIYFLAVMEHRVNDHLCFYTRLLRGWEDKKTDAVTCCLHQDKPHQIAWKVTFSGCIS